MVGNKNFVVNAFPPLFFCVGKESLGHGEAEGESCKVMS